MEYEERQESAPDNTQAIPKIKDRFLDLPKRTKVINDDDVTNLRIALGTANTVEELLAQI